MHSHTQTHTQKRPREIILERTFQGNFKLMLCLKKKFKSDVLFPLGEGPAARRARCYFPPAPLLQLRAPHGAELGAPAPPKLGSPHPAELWGWSTGKSPGSGGCYRGYRAPPSRANQSPADPPRSEPVCCSPAKQHPKEMEPFHPPQMPPQFALRTQNTRQSLSTS